MKRLFVIGFLILALAPATGSAIPLLQLYVEGATFDAATETWVTTASNFKLWVIANVSGPGGTGGLGIADVRLSTAFLTSEVGSITLTASTTALVTDPSTPAAPVFQSSGVGDRPTMSDGSLLPAHGIYGAGTSWTAYSLGDMLAADSPIADFNGSSSFPGPADFFANAGQINVYDVSVTGYSQVHFDTYNHVFGETDAKFAPFSHDAGQVPEPGTVILLGAALTSAAIGRRRRKGN